MGYSQGRDKHLLHIGTHEVMYDKYQLVIRHPRECAGRGATCDQRKTFHPLHLAVEKLATCGEVLTDEQLQMVRDCGQRVALVERG